MSTSGKGRSPSLHNALKGRDYREGAKHSTQDRKTRLLLSIREDEYRVPHLPVVQQYRKSRVPGPNLFACAIHRGSTTPRCCSKWGYRCLAAERRSGERVPMPEQRRVMENKYCIRRPIAHVDFVDLQAQSRIPSFPPRADFCAKIRLFVGCIKLSDDSWPRCVRHETAGLRVHGARSRPAWCHL